MTITDAPRGPAGTGRTVITDIDIPFWRLVVIFIKFGIASIPAAIVISIIIMLIGLLATAIFGIGAMTFVHPQM